MIIAGLYILKTKYNEEKNILHKTHFKLGQTLEPLVLVSSNVTTLTPPTYLPCNLQGVLLLTNGKSYLEVCFTLRCLQRLSYPDLATLL